MARGWRVPSDENGAMNETLSTYLSGANGAFIAELYERWLVDPPTDRPDLAAIFERLEPGVSREEQERLFALPERAELDGILYVHGSPLSDVESFPPQPGDDDERLLAGVADRTIVFGHSHQQFRRPGPNGTDLGNPGRGGMPLDGDPRAAWATWDGDFAFRRVEYDVERAAASFRALDSEVGPFFADRILRGSD